MTITENSQTVFNGYISIMRNMYLTSSIGLAAMAFSDKFTSHKKIVKILSLCIFIYSAFYGFNSTRYFNQYLELLRKQKNLSELNQMQLRQWSEWIYLSYMYIVILIMMCFVIFFKKIL